MNKVVAIIQARVGSTRLPAKVLKVVCGKTLLQHTLDRVAHCSSIDQVVVATTINKKDDAVAETCSKLDVSVYRGSENDVLDRYYQSAKMFGAGIVVRITADCPVIDSAIIGSAVEMYKANRADYVSNTVIETFPDGQDVEVFSFQSLEKAYKLASLPSEREHVTPFIKNHPDLFAIKQLLSNEDLKTYRLTVDTEEDFKLISDIIDNLTPNDPFFSCSDIIRYLKTKPELIALNSHITRNEGYLISLKNDHSGRLSEQK